MFEPCISVVVPTYNRAHLLKTTLPTYLQPEVLELIVIDDCSQDRTEDTVRELAHSDSRIRYIRSEQNLKQPHAKNLGIRAARAPYVYFGDDDSLLLPGSLGFLLETMHRYKADIVGARAPYMERKEQVPQALRLYSYENAKKMYAADWQSIIHPISIQARFETAVDRPLEVPFVHAAFLVSKTLAERILFDESYTGNCYREETDFLIRARASGASIWYDSRAAQVNLPREMASGGAHTASGSFIMRKLKIFRSQAENNWRFLNKNRAALRQTLGNDISPLLRQSLFLAEIARVILSYPLRKVFGHEC